VLSHPKRLPNTGNTGPDSTSVPRAFFSISRGAVDALEQGLAVDVELQESSEHGQSCFGEHGK
jgi:hypothetical protein